MNSGQFAITLFVQAVVLWITAELMRSDPWRARWIVAVFLIANAVQTVIAGVYLFTAPLVMSLLVTLCLGVAVVRVREAPSGRLRVS